MEGLITVVSFGDFLRFVVNKRREKMAMSFFSD